jgi:pimeloyl-ACP methyl ester carboxylesterase
MDTVISDDELFALDEFALLGENAAQAGYADPLPAVERVERGPISALRWGTDLPRVVFLHGGGQNAHTWDTVILGLGLPALAIDLPGHGRSAPAAEMSPEALFAGFSLALDHALDADVTGGGDGRAVVFGNSLGGAMAVQWAIERPERTRALILASPAGAALPAADMAAFLTRFAFPDRAAVLDFMRRLNPRVPLGASLIAADIRANFHRPAIRALIASVGPQHGFAPERVGGIQAPTLLVWGKADGLMPPEMLAWYRTHLPASARIDEPEGVGHCPQVDRPAWTVRTILEFTQQPAMR